MLVDLCWEMAGAGSGVCQLEANSAGTALGGVSLWALGGRGIPLRCMWPSRSVHVSGIPHRPKWRVSAHSLGTLSLDFERPWGSTGVFSESIRYPLSKAL